MDTTGIAKKKYREAGWFERIGETLGRFFGPSLLRSVLRAGYHQMLMLGTRGRGIRCLLPQGEIVHVLPAYRFASWNKVEYEAFKAFTRPGDVALDVGANVGTYSVLLGQWVGSAGKVFAFEPAPETFAALSCHILMNKLEGTVVPFPDAIADYTGVTNFLAENFQGTNRLAHENESLGGTSVMKQVQTTTIDEFCQTRDLKPDLIKIDIEGFELAALRGARETIRSRRGKLALFVEMHPATWKVLGLHLEDLQTELELQGLEARPLQRSDDPWKIEGVCMRLVEKW